MVLIRKKSYAGCSIINGFHTCFHELAEQDARFWLVHMMNCGCSKSSGALRWIMKWGRQERREGLPAEAYAEVVQYFCHGKGKRDLQKRVSGMDALSVNLSFLLI